MPESSEAQRAGIGLSNAGAIRREQALCAEAMNTGEFDNLSDAEWVALCEKLGRQMVAQQHAQDHEGMLSENNMDTTPAALPADPPPPNGPAE